MKTSALTGARDGKPGGMKDGKRKRRRRRRRRTFSVDRDPRLARVGLDFDFLQLHELFSRSLFSRLEQFTKNNYHKYYAILQNNKMAIIRYPNNILDILKSHFITSQWLSDDQKISNATVSRS